MSEINSPAIRFAGFTDAWEQREFAELVSRVSTMSDRKYDMPRVEYEDIISGQGQLNKNIYEKQSNKRGIHFEPGDILFGKLRPYLQNWLAPDFTGIAVGDWWVLKPQGVNTEFICALLQSPQYQRVSNLSTGTKMPRSDWSVVARTTFAVPSQICEQAQIGKTFTNIDRLITLHQREHDKTVNIKKALLEKMFPKDGEDKPEIRFAGFTGAWEQRRVGEFYFFKNGLNKSKEYFGKGTPIINFTDVFHNRGLKAKQLQGKVLLDDNEIKNFEVRQGDIFFTRTSETIDEIGYPSVMLDTPESTVFSGFVLRGRAIEDDPMTNIFKRYVFFTQTFRSEMIKKSSMTTRALTSGTAIKEMCFNFPVSKKEQEQIGLFFANFDRLIALHQRELTKFQNIKKALLEKMFV